MLALPPPAVVVPPFGGTRLEVSGRGRLFTHRHVSLLGREQSAEAEAVSARPAEFVRRVHGGSMGRTDSPRVVPPSRISRACAGGTGVGPPVVRWITMRGGYFLYKDLSSGPNQGPTLQLGSDSLHFQASDDYIPTAGRWHRTWGGLSQRGASLPRRATFSEQHAAPQARLHTGVTRGFAMA